MIAVSTRTLVVHVRVAPYDVYIGRRARGGFAASRYASPFPITAEVSRAQSLALFAAYLDTMLAADAGFLEPLRDKVLGCWCRPHGGFQGRLLCHGQIMVGRLLGVPPESVE